MCGSNVGVVLFPTKDGVVIILVQEYFTPRIMYAEVPDVIPVMMLCFSVIGTLHVKYIVFVHVIVEGSRVMIIRSVAGGFYNYASFLIPQDKTYQ